MVICRSTLGRSSNVQVPGILLHDHWKPQRAHRRENLGRKKSEAQQRKYFRWTLGLNQCTRNAIVMDETKCTPIYITTGTRAMRFEERSRTSPCATLKACVADMRNGTNKRFRTARRQFGEGGGIGEVELDRERTDEENQAALLGKRHCEVFEQVNGGIIDSQVRHGQNKRVT